MKLFIKITLVLMLFTSNILISQQDEVREGLQQIATGQIDKVKMKLPDLLAEYPDSPGVQLLHGVVIEDGYKAVDKFMGIIVNFPESEWADDAYWRIVQFYAILGDTNQAKLHLNNYRKKYPTSEFLSAATDAVKAAFFRERINSKARDYTAEVIEEPEEVEEVMEEEVDEEIIETEEASTSTKGHFGLQVGIYSTYESAKLEVERFQAMRMLAEIKNKKLGNETMYAVVIGDYTSKTSAENAKHIVQQQCKCIPIIFEK